MSEISNWRVNALRWLKMRARPGSHMRIDSRDVMAGDVFVALRGAKTDALSFVPVAAARGARAVVSDVRPELNQPCELERLEVEKLEERLGFIASDFYECPSKDLFGIAITGTNGKTSISHWCSALFTRLGMPCAAIGTIGTYFEGASVKSPPLTTPDAVSTQGLFYDLREAGAKAFAIEASSIGLVRGRLSGTCLKTAVFSNLTRDHLDYHGTEEAYAKAKAILFEWPDLEHAVINLDDAFGRQLAKRTTERGIETLGYAVEGVSSSYDSVEPVLVAKNVQSGSAGMCFDVEWKGKTYRLEAKVLGLFNVYNLLAVALVALSAGFEPTLVFENLAELQPPAGRLQVFARPGMPLAVVDYCHTPDAIEKALSALRPSVNKRGGHLWIVFGAGGDRDHGKRPVMGAVAEKNADFVVVTSDNPRTEEPDEIAKEICEGMSASCPVVLDRRQAIIDTFCRADPRDVVLVAGKGHEEYQEINGIKHHFSDTETVREAANERFVREKSHEAGSNKSELDH